MQQAGHLRDRVMREIDTALALNAEQMAGGACETMLTNSLIFSNKQS